MYVYLLIPLKVTRLPSRIYIFRINIFLSSVLTISFLFYVFLITTSFITLYLIFYLILLAPPRLARHVRSPSFLRSILYSTLSYFSPHASPALLLSSPSLHFSYLFSTFIHFHTVSFPSLVDFRFSLIHSILTFILVPLFSPVLLLHSRFFLF